MHVLIKTIAPKVYFIYAGSCCRHTLRITLASELVNQLVSQTHNLKFLNSI